MLFIDFYARSFTIIFTFIEGNIAVPYPITFFKNLIFKLNHVDNIYIVDLGGFIWFIIIIFFVYVLLPSDFYFIKIFSDSKNNIDLN